MNRPVSARVAEMVSALRWTFPAPVRRRCMCGGWADMHGPLGCMDLASPGHVPEEDLFCACLLFIEDTEPNIDAQTCPRCLLPIGRNCAVRTWAGWVHADCAVIGVAS